MKILVTGAAGQLAREVVRQLAALGHQVTAAGRAELDITDFRGVSEVLKSVRPQFAVNCAAFNDVDGAEASGRDAMLVNGVGARNLAHACNGAGAALVHFSTDYVFDGRAGRPYTIADRPNPLSTYGRSKLLGETSVRDHAERFFLVRTSWVFGGGKASFPLKLMRWASGKDALRMVEDQVSTPTYAADLAGAVIKLMETGNYGLYHVTNSGSASRYEWAEHVLKATGWKGRLEPADSGEFKSPAARPAYSVLDNFPLEETIGELLPPWQDAVDRFLKEAL
jgi:dTDP-4-dehydrorhamnose reductase